MARQLLASDWNRWKQGSKCRATLGALPLSDEVFGAKGLTARVARPCRRRGAPGSPGGGARYPVVRVQVHLLNSPDRRPNEGDPPAANPSATAAATSRGWGSQSIKGLARPRTLHNVAGRHRLKPTASDSGGDGIAAADTRTSAMPVRMPAPRRRSVSPERTKPKRPTVLIEVS